MDTSFYKIYRILIRILTTNRMASRISFQAGPRLSDPRKFNSLPPPPLPFDIRFGRTLHHHLGWNKEEERKCKFRDRTPKPTRVCQYVGVRWRPEGGVGQFIPGVSRTRVAISKEGDRRPLSIHATWPDVSANEAKKDMPRPIGWYTMQCYPGQGSDETFKYVF